ncbi:hypothetical protein [Paenibacillus daejeonensis]|uniref:hypothetical protein n=1 Tax=Paenibacillus daejeonensis TaxID=135193 RepID=UPI0003689D73|nr:hypothetical protein [Paenibacillus daejeonensis]
MKKIKSFAVALIALSVTLIPISLANATTETYFNQDVTAYVAPSGSLTYSGTTPSQYVTAAVHPKIGGSPNSGLKFPYGAIITVGGNGVSTPGGFKSTFLVSDMGDVYLNRGLSSAWFDIYFGVGSSPGHTNYDAAVNFGKKKVNYYVTW